MTRAAGRMDCLGIRVDAFTRRSLAETIAEAAKNGKRCVITYLNAHCVNTAYSDPEYRRLLESADCVHADGMGVVWAARFCGRRLPQRVNVIDFFPLVSEDLAGKGLRLYLVGGAPDVVRQAAERLRREHGLDVCGYHDGYFDDKAEHALVKEINRLKPDILVVGMGVPKQEKWVFRVRDRLEVKLFWIAGSGMFDNLSGKRGDAPRWMAGTGLEWLFRLCQDPVRLWKRYLLGNPLFVYRMLRFRLMDTASRIKAKRSTAVSCREKSRD